MGEVGAYCNRGKLQLGQPVMLHCGNCNTDLDLETKFCTDCGGAVESQAIDTDGQQEGKADSLSGSRGRQCPACHKTDPLNEAYCLYCGAVLPDRVVSGEVSTDLARRDRNTQDVSPPTSSFKGSVFAVASICLALLAAGWLAFNFFSPRAGVLVHASPPDAAVVVQDSKGFVVASSELDEDGICRLDSLSPGHYKVVLAAQGRLSQTREVELVASHVTALGVPEPIELGVAPAKSGQAVVSTPAAPPAVLANKAAVSPAAKSGEPAVKQARPVAASGSRKNQSAAVPRRSQPVGVRAEFEPPLAPATPVHRVTEPVTGRQVMPSVTYNRYGRPVPAALTHQGFLGSSGPFKRQSGNTGFGPMQGSQRMPAGEEGMIRKMRRYKEMMEQRRKQGVFE